MTAGFQPSTVSPSRHNLPSRHPGAWRRRKQRWTSNANGAATWRPVDGHLVGMGRCGTMVGRVWWTCCLGKILETDLFRDWRLMYKLCAKFYRYTMKYEMLCWERWCRKDIKVMFPALHRTGKIWWVAKCNVGFQCTSMYHIHPHTSIVWQSSCGVLVVFFRQLPSPRRAPSNWKKNSRRLKSESISTDTCDRTSSVVIVKNNIRM